MSTPTPPSASEPSKEAMALPLTSQFSEYWGQYTICDANKRYVATVTVYQTPRHMGLIDESQRHANAAAILESCNNYPKVLAELASLRARAELADELAEELETYRTRLSPTLTERAKQLLARHSAAKGGRTT